MRRERTRFLAGLALTGALVLPATASAHIERPAYWPDPAPDTAVTPPAGGGVPEIRSLYTALDTKPPGDTRVVCQGPVPSRKNLTKAEKALKAARKKHAAKRTIAARKRAVAKARKKYAAAVARNPSIVALKAAIAKARAEGYRYRPSEDARTLTAKEAAKLLAYNERLLGTCAFQEIQPAVTASTNNDRVVIMPGLYTEPSSRKKPKNDPACEKYLGYSDYPQRGGAATYAYHYHCPNDAALVAVIGREPGKTPPPNPPNIDRHGIPDLGPCIRCNFQLEGSGVTADDVIIEAGDASKGNKGPSAAGAVKDVGVTVERADGFVLTNMTVRHAREHNIYVIEADGYVLDRFKTFYPGLYGTLQFVEDHGLTQNCEAVGGGDSGIYPGAPAETGEQRKPGTDARYNQEIRWCDMHHNLAGFSATNGNALWLHDNEIYDNALGFTTDIATAAGHPGFPDDSDLIEHNNFHSNNFNPFDAGSDVKAAFPYPVGTGLWIAGGNNHTIRRNHFYDNWRRGVMLFTVPDALVCGPDSGNVQAGCDASKLSTSHRNRFYENVMGESPDGKAMPNGTDFWWDSFPSTTANCWYNNRGIGGAAVTMSPANLPDCAGGVRTESSTGSGDAGNEGEIVTCAVAFETGNFDPSQPCPWFHSPSKPGSAQARAESDAARSEGFRRNFQQFCSTIGPEATCGPYRTLLGLD